MSLVLSSTRGKSINLTEVWRMDDTGCRGFFLEPVATYHRQYEALRAFFSEGRRLHDIAQQFGYRETSLRSMVCRFRAHAHAGRGGVSLPALVGPCTLRAPGQPSRLSWLHDGARDQCVIELARPEAPGQRTAQPHQRLELRRGRWLVCGPQCPPQEILRDRLLLSHRA